MSGYISADDFLTGILGEPIDLDVPGLGRVQIKPLSMLEVKQMREQYGADGMGLTVGAVAMGMVAPKLDKEQAARLWEARPGPLTTIGQRILEISGMTEDAPNAVGAGS
jgi:hypothetical protein